MNYLSAFRLLVHFSLLLLLLISCKSKSQTRQVQKSKLPSKKSGIEKKPKEVVTPAIQSDPAGTPKPSNEDGQAPGNPNAMKSNRNKNKEKTTRADPTQRDSNIQPPPSSATFQLCTTQEEEVQSKKKPVLKEEYFEDQNDDDTLVCVKSIEN